MEYNHDLSDEISSKELLIKNEDFLFQQNLYLNDAQTIEKKNSIEKETHINKKIEDESFKKHLKKFF